jgi:hypothetical protein
MLTEAEGADTDEHAQQRQKPKEKQQPQLQTPMSAGATTGNSGKSSSRSPPGVGFHGRLLTERPNL